jgi:hypothetical protein
MALGTAATIGLGLGAVGGMVAGSRKTPGTKLAPAYGEVGEQEKQLQQQAMQQYLQQLAQTQQFEQGISQLDPLRQQALQGYQDVLGGQAFQASPQELQQIDQLRQAQIGLGTQDINRLLGEATSQTSQMAGVRGLRGQALAQLQGQNNQAASQQIGNVVNSANMQAAQQAMENPFRRVAAQTPFMQQGLTYQDQLRQQAIQNRQLAANPAMLNYFQQGRATQQVTPSSGGGFLGGLAGAISGAGAGLGFGNALSGLGGLGGGASSIGGMNASNYSNRFGNVG